MDVKASNSLLSGLAGRKSAHRSQLAAVAAALTDLESSSSVEPQVDAAPSAPTALFLLPGLSRALAMSMPASLFPVTSSCTIQSRKKTWPDMAARWRAAAWAAAAQLLSTLLAKHVRLEASPSPNRPRLDSESPWYDRNMETSSSSVSGSSTASGSRS